MSRQRTDARGLPQVTKVSEGSSRTVVTLVSIAVVVLVLAMAGACLKHYTQQVSNGKLGLGPEGGAETHFDYQVRLCGETQTLQLFVCSYLRVVISLKIPMFLFLEGSIGSPLFAASSSKTWF